MKPEARITAFRLFLVNAIAMLLIAIGPMASSYTNEKYQAPGKIIAPPDIVVPGWSRLPAGKDISLKPRVQGADFSRESRFQKQGLIIDFYFYGYTSNQGGKEIVSHENSPYDRKLWVKAKQGVHVISSAGGRTLSVNEVQVSNGKVSRLIHYFYRIGGDFIHSPFRVKAKEILQKLLAQDLDSRLYVISTNIRGNIADSRAVLREFELVLMSGN